MESDYSAETVVNSVILFFCFLYLRLLGLEMRTILKPLFLIFCDGNLNVIGA